MRRLRLFPQKYGKTDVEVIEKESTTFLDRVNLSKERDRVRVARRIGVDPGWLLRVYRDEETDITIPQDKRPVQVHIRGRLQSNEESVLLKGEDFISAMESAITWRGEVYEPIISWDDNLPAALDVDFHDEKPLHDARVLLSLVSPRPRISWITHGGGLRLLYGCPDLPAAAAVDLEYYEPSATFELKHSTRHPVYPIDGRECSEVFRSFGPECLGRLGTWLGGKTAEEDEVRDWLAGQGLEIGERYSHDRCPMDPVTKGGRQPVCVYEEGIFCYACQGHGVCRGGRSPGWFPYSLFVGHHTESCIGECVANMTHWNHARHIFRAHSSLSDELLYHCYRLLLRDRWHDDPRLDRIDAGKDYLRFRGYWADNWGESYSSLRLFSEHAKWPTCRYLDDGEEKIDKSRVQLMSQTVDIPGYPSLVPVRGIRIYGHHLSPRYPYTVLIQSKEQVKAGLAPRYVVDRDVEQSWNIMRHYFPGVSRPVIELLIAAKGCAETDGSMVPMLFLTGPTAAAKSTSVILAAAICGDSCHSIPMMNNDERVRSAILAAKGEASFVVFNEAMKPRDRLSKAESMEYALSLTPDSVVHKLYVGPVRLGALPVFVWTDTYLSMEVKRNAQLARRIIYAHLYDKVDWHASMRETGLAKAENLRTVPELAGAADAVLSHVIDAYFKAPRTFGEIANMLGFSFVADSEEAVENIVDLITFFREAISQPRGIEDIVRWPCEKWRVFYVDSETTLARLWRELADRDLKHSQRCAEADWRTILAADRQVEFCTRSWGRKVAIKWEGIEYEETLRRLGDAECREPVASGFPEIPGTPFDSIAVGGLEDRR